MSIEELLEHAQRVPAGADGLVMRPLSGDAPSLEAFAGAKSQHGHGHYARAILESTATSLAGLLAQLFADAPPEAVCATGGASRSDLWLQIKANTLGTPFIRTRCPEPACLGAGLFAAVACGWFPGLAEASEVMVSTSKMFAPDSPQPQ
jgi:sugar (pentulose or hexulose) kinase